MCSDLGEWIRRSTPSSRLGAIYVIDSIARAAMKLHEKDPSWNNVYYDLFPTQLGPIMSILFNVGDKEKVFLFLSL